MQGSSSGTAAPAPFESGSVCIVFFTIWHSMVISVMEENKAGEGDS